MYIITDGQMESICKEIASFSTNLKSMSSLINLLVESNVVKGDVALRLIQLNNRLARVGLNFTAIFEMVGYQFSEGNNPAPGPGGPGTYVINCKFEDMPVDLRKAIEECMNGQK